MSAQDLLELFQKWLADNTRDLPRNIYVEFLEEIQTEIECRLDIEREEE